MSASITVTCAPAAASHSDKLDPMNPRPPVTTHRRVANRSASVRAIGIPRTILYLSDVTPCDRAASLGCRPFFAEPEGPGMEQAEYERMADVEETHWWYQSTRHLLQAVLAPYLTPGGRYLDAGYGT